MTAQTSNGAVPALNPPVKWAQRKDMVLLTFEVEDCKNPTIDVQPDKLHFKAVGGAEKHVYDTVIPFYAEVNPEGVRKVQSDLHIEMAIPKKESGPFWPRLFKEKVKVHWLKVDFDKWKDEDEEDEPTAGDQFDLNSMMGQMGNFDERPDLGDFGEDSDNEDLPDLEEDVAEDGIGPSTSKVPDESEEEKAKKAAAGDAAAPSAQA